MCAKKVEELYKEKLLPEQFPQEMRYFYAPEQTGSNTNEGLADEQQELKEPEDFDQEDDSEAIDADFYDTTYSDPAPDDDTPQVHRIGLIFSGFLALLLSVLFFLVDTNGDAYIINEALEYLFDTMITSLWTWIAGLGFNAIPNIPESLLLFSLLMIKLQPLFMRHRRTAEHQNQVQIIDEETPPIDQQGENLLEHEEHDHNESDHHEADHHPSNTQLATVHGHSHHHKHTVGELIGEIFIMGVTPGALGFASFFMVLSEVWLPWRILISLGAGVVSGGADWIKHSYFNHEAYDVDDQHPLVRTFGTNLWFTDRSIGWKLHETWVKTIVLIHHGGTGLFNWYAVLKVTSLATMIPRWGCMLIAGAFASPGLVIEGISETHAYDAEQKRPNFEIHPVTRLGLTLGGIIHSLSFVVISCQVVYQATFENNGQYYYLINLAIFSAGSVLFLYPGTLGYFRMQKNPPIDERGKEGFCFDDIIRLMLRTPRPDRRLMNYQLRSNVRFWKSREQEPLRVEELDNETRLTEINPRDEQQGDVYRFGIADDDAFSM